jgi:hypothetical protein
MRTGPAGGLLALTLLLATSSCTRLSDLAWARQRKGPITLEALQDSIAVPSAWGNLVSVTPNAAVANTVHLWFQDAQGNVRAVTYDAKWERLWVNVVLIGRR